jgi:hypothetical protein
MAERLFHFSTSTLAMHLSFSALICASALGVPPLKENPV